MDPHEKHDFLDQVGVQWLCQKMLRDQSVLQQSQDKYGKGRGAADQWLTEGNTEEEGKYWLVDACIDPVAEEVV